MLVYVTIGDVAFCCLMSSSLVAREGAAKPFLAQRSWSLGARPPPLYISTGAIPLVARPPLRLS